MSLEDMLKMPLHSSASYNKAYMIVKRVPGGWLYMCGPDHTFVPEPSSICDSNNTSK